MQSACVIQTPTYEFYSFTAFLFKSLDLEEIWKLYKTSNEYGNLNKTVSKKLCLFICSSKREVSPISLQMDQIVECMKGSIHITLPAFPFDQFPIFHNMCESYFNIFPEVLNNGAFENLKSNFNLNFEWTVKWLQQRVEEKLTDKGDITITADLKYLLHVTSTEKINKMFNVVHKNLQSEAKHDVDFDIDTASFMAYDKLGFAILNQANTETKKIILDFLKKGYYKINKYSYVYELLIDEFNQLELDLQIKYLHKYFGPCGASNLYVTKTLLILTQLYISNFNKPSPILDEISKLFKDYAGKNVYVHLEMLKELLFLPYIYNYSNPDDYQIYKNKLEVLAIKLIDYDKSLIKKLIEYYRNDIDDGFSKFILHNLLKNTKLSEDEQNTLFETHFEKIMKIDKLNVKCCTFNNISADYPYSTQKVIKMPQLIELLEDIMRAYKKNRGEATRAFAQPEESDLYRELIKEIKIPENELAENIKFLENTRSTTQNTKLKKVINFKLLILNSQKATKVISNNYNLETNELENTYLREFGMRFLEDAEPIFQSGFSEVSLVIQNKIIKQIVHTANINNVWILKNNIIF